MVSSNVNFLLNKKGTYIHSLQRKNAANIIHAPKRIICQPLIFRTFGLFSRRVTLAVPFMFRDLKV